MKGIVCGSRTLRLHYIPETCGFTVCTGGKEFATVTGAEPWILFRDGRRLFFREASECTVQLYPCGAGEGILATYSGFPDIELSFSLYLWVEEATDRVHAEWIPLRESSAEIAEVAWPPPLASYDAEAGYAVLNLMNGKLLRDDDEEEVHPVMSRRFLGREAYMPFFGQVRGDAGYLAVVETPWDAAYTYDHLPHSATEIGMRWIPSLGQMSYRRCMFYRFYPTACDYVDFCKEYRGYVKEQGRFVSLREKMERNPLLRHMIGAPVIHTPSVCVNIVPASQYYDREHPERNHRVMRFSALAEELEALYAEGVRGAYVHIDGWGKRGYDNLHPDLLPPCEEAGGYAGMADLLTRLRRIGYLPAIHDNYRDYYTDAATYAENQAQVYADGRYEWESVWHGGMQRKLCGELALGYLRRNYTQLREHGCLPDGAYLDVFSVVELDECAHPMHRMTRRECLARRCECFDYVRSLGMVVSSEEPIDGMVSHLELVHHAPDFWGKMRGIAVPLFALVYHDSLFIPSYLGRGEGCPREHAGFLYALMQGNLPYLSLHADGEERARVELVCRLNRAVWDQELLAHRLLDRTGSRQQSEFADGTCVEVDLSENRYRIRWADGSVSEGQI